MRIRFVVTKSVGKGVREVVTFSPGEFFFVSLVKLALIIFLAPTVLLLAFIIDCTILALKVTWWVLTIIPVTLIKIFFRH